MSENDGWKYNPEGVGIDKKYSFDILKLPPSATEREIKVKYQRLARIYHTYSYDSSTNIMTKIQYQEHFKLINNTYEHLQNQYYIYLFSSTYLGATGSKL